MTDRELLEKAAQAAGIDLDWHGRDCCRQGDVEVWNPLTDDGDALRLAVQIGPLEFSISEYGTAVRKPKGQWVGCEAHLHGGKQAATRRAIVRVAAALAPADAQQPGEQEP